MAADPAGRTQRARDTLRFALRAFRHRNFRLFTAGQSISLIGTWMQQVALGWLVYRLTESALLLGLVAFVSQGPGLVLAPLAGVLADRYHKQRIIVITQVIMMVQALLLATLILTDSITIAHILLLSGVLGAASGFDIPARQAFLIEMVGDRVDLPNAIALNSSIFNAARLVGPALAGFAIAAFGEGLVILLNGLSYLAVIAALLSMRLPPHRRTTARGAVLRRMAEGFRYAFGFPPIRTILTTVATISLCGVPFTVLLPVVATDVLEGGPEVLGFLMAATGMGALIGALFLATRTTVRGLGRVIVAAACCFGGALLFVGWSRSLVLTMALLACAGFGMMAAMASSNTILQTLVDDDKRGRVMSLYSMAFIGTAPLGSLLYGLAAERVGAAATMSAGGLLCLAAAAVFGRQIPALRVLVRPIYTRLGIIPEVARGIQAVTQQTTPVTSAVEVETADA